MNWEEPPERAHIIGKRNRSGKYLDFAIGLRERPGHWARLDLGNGETRTPASATGLAQNIHRGEVKGFAKGDYEAAVHGSEVWARYIGKKGGPKAVPSAAEDDQEDESPEDIGDQLQPKVSDVDPAAVRRWARTHGYDISAHGRLPESIIKAYRDAPPDQRRPARLVSD